MRFHKINALTLWILLSALMILNLSAGEEGIFLVSPSAGRIESDIQFTSPGGQGMRTLSDSGPLYALMMMYTSPQFTLGSMGHYSRLDKSTENGYMFYGLYSFMKDSNIQPVAGFYADYIHVLTRAKEEDVAPLSSMDVDTSIWALHAIAGLKFKRGEQKITPFLGYFNEQVDTALSSEGMRIAGQKKNGFSTDASDTIDYMSAGIKAELKFFQFIRFDTKFYWRFKEGEDPLFTSRNRLDIFLSKSSGVSLKYDYFDDRYEKNSFLFIGPVFVF